MPEQDVTPVTLDTIKQAVTKSPADHEEKKVERSRQSKTEEVTQVENVQNTTSNDVEEKSQGKSDDKRKWWVRNINKAKTVGELNEIRETFIIDEMLTEDHKNYLSQSSQSWLLFSQTAI